MRHKSPLKPRNYEASVADERDQIIGKLKDDLIVARGKEK